MKTVESKILIEEIDTDGHSPMKFICSDGAIYFAKYRSGKSFDKNEIHCLVFEMLCTALLKRLHIPVPDDALITINEDSYVKGQLKVNKRYVEEGVIAWGSKEIPNTDLVKEIEFLQKKKEFNKIKNPEDLIKIAVFDLWVDNADRHSGNYNLLTEIEGGKIKVITIDHAFAFGGLKGMNIFNATTAPQPHKKIIESQYFRSIVKYFNKAKRIEIGNQFISLLEELDTENIINDVFSDIPHQWQINETLKTRIIGFLTSAQRINAIRQICSQQLQKNLRRKKQ